MNLFPLKAQVGKTRYVIDRESPCWLVLKRYNSDGMSQIFFPELLILDLAKQAVNNTISSLGDEFAKRVIAQQLDLE